MKRARNTKRVKNTKRGEETHFLLQDFLAGLSRYAVFLYSDKKFAGHTDSTKFLQYYAGRSISILLSKFLSKAGTKS
jgi:hypothetical protein